MSEPITKLCSFIRTNGDGCKGIPLTGKNLCYYHQRQHDRQYRIDLNFAHRTSMLAHGHPHMLFNQLPDGSQLDANSAELFNNLQLPDFEDADAIQSTLSMLFRVTATGQVNPKAAGVMAYMLQLALANLHRTKSPGRDTSIYQDSDPVPVAPDYRSDSRSDSAPDSAPRDETAETSPA